MLLITFECPVHSTRALVRCQNVSVTLVPIALVLFKSYADGNLACHSQYSYYAGDNPYRHCCLFSDSVICLYIIVLLERAVHSKAVVLLLLTFCLLLLPLWESVIVLCFVVRYFVSVLELQSSWWGRESWLLCLICLPGVL